jgi:hypothetical protein
MMKDEQKRRENEKNLGQWIELASGGRLYYYEVQAIAVGRHATLKKWQQTSKPSDFTKKFMIKNEANYDDYPKRCCTTTD